MALFSQARKSDCGTAQPSSKHLDGYVGCQNHYPIRRLKKKTGKTDRQTNRQTDRQTDRQKLTCRSSANFVSAGQKSQSP